MAVEYVKGKNNTLGMLGALANIAGTATGQPWLTVLGTGMDAMNSMVNGEVPSKEQQGGLSDLLKSMKGWSNPASNTIDKVKKIASKVQSIANQVQPTDEELMRKWGAYNTRRYSNGWQL